MTNIFKTIITMSAAGGGLALLLLAIKPITMRFFSPKWQYYIWLTVIAVMLLPASFSLPQRAVVPDNAPVADQAQSHTAAEFGEHTKNAAFIQEEQKPVLIASLPKRNTAQLLAWLWLIGAIAAFAVKAWHYVLFAHTLKAGSMADSDVQLTGRLRARRTEMTDSPMIIGLFRPILYLPPQGASCEEYILRHELVHYRRHDLWYKWLAAAAACIHWFNPMIYAVLHQIDESCEISCDAEAVKNLSEEEKKHYMALILELVQGSVKRSRPLTTRMAGGKNTLKRRFFMITKGKQTSRLAAALSIFTAAIMMSAAVLASGLISGAAKISDGDYALSVNGSDIRLDNEPVFENGTVYLPLRETLERSTADFNLEWSEDYGVGMSIGGYNFLMEAGTSYLRVYKLYGGKPAILEGLSAPLLLINSSCYIPCRDLQDILAEAAGVELSCTAYDGNGEELTERARISRRIYPPDTSREQLIQSIDSETVFQLTEDYINTVIFSPKPFSSEVITCDVDGDRAVSYSKILSADDDSYDYLTIEFRKNNGAWEVYEYYLEK